MPDYQKEVLLSLVQGGEGQDWANRQEGWSKYSAPESVCLWDGIVCDDDSHETVVAINLPSADLRATIPWELGHLPNLKEINLSDNMIRGSIPDGVAALPNLETFNIANNKIYGQIPYFQSSVLETFNASNNVLSGSVPDDFGRGHSKLYTLDVTGNRLTGTIPKSIKEMHNLNTLSFSENSMSGLLPTTLGKVANLEFLYLDNNYFVGPIPPTIAHPGGVHGENIILQEIWLHGNLLSGTVPAALADLEMLWSLFVDGNKFTGTIHKDLCARKLNEDFLANVPEADRDYCESVACPVNTVSLEGVYPCTTCDSNRLNPYLGQYDECWDVEERDILQSFYRSTTMSGPWNGEVNWDGPDVCSFSGITCDNSGHVVAIQLRARGLTGTIPQEIGFMEYLQTLDLSDNDLTGYLPSDLRWAPLEYLDISGNRIRSIVPPMLCLKDGINGNGDGGDYNCDHIACPGGTFSSIGRKTTEGDVVCTPCADDELVLGSKSCAAGAVSPSAAAGVAGKAILGGLFLGLALVALVLGAVALAQRLRRNDQREKISQEETEQEGDAPPTKFNERGVSSLPYTDVNLTDETFYVDEDCKPVPKKKKSPRSVSGPFPF